MRAVPALSVLATLLTACGGDPFAQGTARTCLGTDAGGEAPPTGERGAWAVEGTVTAQGLLAELPEASFDLAPCFAPPTRALELTDARGARWWVGWFLEDDEDADASVAIPVSVDDPVALQFRHVTTGLGASGFTLSTDGWLRAAMEVGTAGPALLAEDVPDVDIATDDRIGTERAECGARYAHSLAFTTEDRRLELRPYETRPLRIRDAEYTATAIQAISWAESTDCSHLAGAVSWSLWWEDGG